MKKTDDFFTAGVVIGCISNILFNIDTLPLILIFGDALRYPWNDLAALFFRPPEVYTFGAQFFGILASFGVAIVNGVVIGGLLKLTGRDFAYLKSIVVCSTSVLFAFMILYPALGNTIEQHNILTTYVAFLNNQPFAIISAFLFLRYTTVGLRMPMNEAGTEESVVKQPVLKFIPLPARKKLRNLHVKRNK